jgi:DNA-binding CsgD family transcriptional regulator
MAKSDLLRFQDACNAYRLIGQCRDLGGDPALWHRQMFEGLRQLIGAPIVTGGEGRWPRPHGAVAPISAYQVGLDRSAFDLYMKYIREVTPARDPLFQALQHIPGQVVTRVRRELVSDSSWYRSPIWNQFHRPARMDDQLISVYQTSDEGGVSVICLHRAPGERAFSGRERRLMSFFHGELGSLIGHALVSETEPRPDALAPRVRQTLGYLLQGDSEKQAARRLGVSQATTHEYVTALYRHFKVSSRAQLMAHAYRRGILSRLAG